MTEYYQELYAATQPHIQAGWRHPFEQYSRFAVACELLDVPGGGALLDIGCGPGDLHDYVQRTQWFASQTSRYHGIDRLDYAVSTAQTRWPNATFTCADLFAEELQPAQTVLAIGAMISGEPCATHERLKRVGRFIERCINVSTHQGCVIMLDQSALEERASIGLEAGLFGVRHGEELHALCAWLGRQHNVNITVRPTSLRSDIVLYWRHLTHTWPQPLIHRDNQALAEHIFDLLDPDAQELYWRGWLYVELGLKELAEHQLNACLFNESSQESHHLQRARNLLAHLHTL